MLIGSTCAGSSTMIRRGSRVSAWVQPRRGMATIIASEHVVALRSRRSRTSRRSSGGRTVSKICDGRCPGTMRDWCSLGRHCVFLYFQGAVRPRAEATWTVVLGRSNRQCRSTDQARATGRCRWGLKIFHFELGRMGDLCEPWWLDARVIRDCTDRVMVTSG